MDTPTKPSTHPVMIIAAVAVVLFCGIGSAAVLGWLPTSNATVPDQLSGMPPAPSTSAAPGPEAAPAPATAAAAAPVARQAPCSNCGVVESVRSVEHRPQGSGVGAVGGALVGGLLGNQVGGGHGRQLATVAGAVGGAVAGNHIEGNMKTTHTWDIVVRMDNGSKRSFQHASQPAWRSGDAVRVVKGQLRAQD